GHGAVEEIELAVHVFNDRIQATSALQLDFGFQVPGDPDLPVNQLRRGHDIQRADLLQLRRMIINAARGITLPDVQFAGCQFLYVEEHRLCTSGVHVHVHPLLRPASPKSRKPARFLIPREPKMTYGLAFVGATMRSRAARSPWRGTFARSLPSPPVRKRGMTMRVHLSPILLSLLLSVGVSGSARRAPDGSQSGSKTVTTKVGEPHFEAPVPSGVPLRLYVRSGDIRVHGSDDSKISVDISGKAQKLDDVKHRLAILEGSAEFHLSG